MDLNETEPNEQVWGLHGADLANPSQNKVKDALCFCPVVYVILYTVYYILY